MVASPLPYLWSLKPLIQNGPSVTGQAEKGRGPFRKGTWLGLQVAETILTYLAALT